uniref:AAA family ATPase n=1 Tax=Bacillus mycoides TaxID=1405 RepID=UPI00119DA3F4
KQLTLDFRNTIFIMTSNLRPQTLKPNKHLPFNLQHHPPHYSHIKPKLIHQFKKPFPPEFLNPIHQIIVFHILH